MHQSQVIKIVSSFPLLEKEQFSYESKRLKEYAIKNFLSRKCAEHTVFGNRYHIKLHTFKIKHYSFGVK